MKKINLLLVAIALLSMAWTIKSTKNDKFETDVEISDATNIWSNDNEEFSQFEKFDPTLFDENSIIIDNEWMPMPPGKELVYKGYDVDDEGEKEPHTILYTVTDLTKVINGINTVVLFERDYTDGDAEELELAFFAQDKEGNVWHFGQYYELWEEGSFLGGSMWAVGHVEGAKAGIMMLANPQLNLPSYSQGYAPPPYNWTDRARIYKMGEKVKNKSGKYTDVLAIEEYNKEEPFSFQIKYYARGVGNVGIGWKGADPNQETMDLVEIKDLKGEALRRVREEALVLEKRALVYSTTERVVYKDMEEDRSEESIDNKK